MNEQTTLEATLENVLQTNQRSAQSQDYIFGITLGGGGTNFFVFSSA